MSSYGIDTSVFVRLLVGQPEADFQHAIDRLTVIRASQSGPIVVANIVIAEAYAVLQHHYGVTKADSRRALLATLSSGLVEPAAGDVVLETIRAAKEPGLTDRLIALDYAGVPATVLTFDRKMATLPGCRRL